MGLVLRAVDPAIQIAALLSVPRAFQLNLGKDSRKSRENTSKHTSDVVRVLEAYQEYRAKKSCHSLALEKEFNQVSRVEVQIRNGVKGLLKQQTKGTASALDWSAWNANQGRLAALAALVCNATPHIAHLTNGTWDFSTRDVAGTAKIHPSSINFKPDHVCHWYLYSELRTTSAPFLHITTAASPLELALFTEATTLDNEQKHDFPNKDDWLFIADQWVPVDLSQISQRKTFWRLRRLLTRSDATSVLSNPLYDRIILFILSSIEQQRLEDKGWSDA